MKNTARVYQLLEAIPHLDMEKTVEAFIKTKQRFILIDYDTLDFMPSKKEVNPVSVQKFQSLSETWPYLERPSFHTWSTW